LEGGKSGAYESLTWRPLPGTETADIDPLTDERVAELLEEVLDELHEAVQQMAAKGLPLPVVGFDLQDGIGEILAEAEFCWESLNMVGLLEDQMEYADLFKRAGWATLTLDTEGEWLLMLESMINEDV
jgi:hypothetical protein